MAVLLDPLITQDRIKGFLRNLLQHDNIRRWRSGIKPSLSDGLSMDPRTETLIPERVNLLPEIVQQERYPLKPRSSGGGVDVVGDEEEVAGKGSDGLRVVSVWVVRTLVLPVPGSTGESGCGDGAGGRLVHISRDL